MGLGEGAGEEMNINSENRRTHSAIHLVIAQVEYFQKLLVAPNVLIRNRLN